MKYTQKSLQHWGTKSNQRNYVISDTKKIWICKAKPIGEVCN